MVAQEEECENLDIFPTVNDFEATNQSTSSREIIECLKASTRYSFLYMVQGLESVILIFL